MYAPIHHSFWLTRPGSASPAFSLSWPISFQRIARTWESVGAVVITRAVPGGYFASQRAAASAAVKLLPALWQLGTASLGTRSSSRRISRCLLYRSMSSLFFTQSTGSSSTAVWLKRCASPATGSVIGAPRTLG
jgi:hypothetical protein